MEEESLIPKITPLGILYVAGFFIVIESVLLSMSARGRLTRSVEEKGAFFFPLLISIFFTWWIGTRPYSGYGDTINYYMGYQSGLANGAGEIIVNFGAEWVWSALTIICMNSGLDATGYFTVVAAGYMLTAMWAIKKFVPTSPMIGLLFLISSLFFFSFGVNGIRNGLACHLLLLGMAFFMEDKRVIAGVIALLAMGVHRSVMLPIAASIAGMTVVRNPKYAFYIWLASIPLSLMFGGFFTGFLAGLGVDDRMASYAEGYNDNVYTNTGYRWDFLLYSAIGVYYYWHVNLRKKKRDGWYNLIATTYMLSNAVWVMINRIEYSNRFAYLSWFLMPVLFAYPLCNMKAWEPNQNEMASKILFGYWGISLFMYTFYW